MMLAIQGHAATGFHGFYLNIPFLVVFFKKLLLSLLIQKDSYTFVTLAKPFIVDGTGPRIEFNY